MNKSADIERFVELRRNLKSKLDRARSLADVVYNAANHSSFFDAISSCAFRDGWTPSQAVVDLMMAELRQRIKDAEKELEEHEAKIQFTSDS